MYPETSEFTKMGAVAGMTRILCPRFSSYVKFIRRRDQRQMIWFVARETQCKRPLRM